MDEVSNKVEIEAIYTTIGRNVRLILPKTAPLELILIESSKRHHINFANLKIIFQVEGKTLDHRRGLDEQPNLSPEDFKDNKITIRISFQSLGA